MNKGTNIMLTIDHTIRTYAGQPGCMCGCKGTYNTSVRARKMAIKALLNDPNVQFEYFIGSYEGCLSVTTATRNRVLYLNEEGVKIARSMGLKERRVSRASLWSAGFTASVLILS